jgi:O-antigen ligase
MNPQDKVAEYIVRSCAIGLAAVLTFYWTAYGILPDLFALLLRPALLALAIVMFLCTLRMPLSGPEVRMVQIFGGLSLVYLLTSTLAEDPVFAFAGLVKLILIQLFCLMLARAFRHEAVARDMGISLLLGSIFISLFIIYLYVHTMGFVLPTYEAVRGFKGLADKQGYALNETPATALLAFFCAACLLPMKRRLWLIGCAVAFIGSFFTGSRAALVAPVAALFLLLVSQGLRSRSVSRKALAGMALTVAVLGIAAVLLLLPSRTLTHVSEGRWDLWRAATSKFMERPLLGWGYGSWKDDIVSRLPGEYKLTSVLVKDQKGGYHNEFINALSEQGIVGFVAILAFMGYGVVSSWKLAFRRPLLWKSGAAALVTMFFLVVRANVEMDGLFGFAQDPVDYLSYIFIAILVAALSAEEQAGQRLQASFEMQRQAFLRQTVNRNRRRMSLSLQSSPQEEL